jgi:hypothetical protein
VASKAVALADPTQLHQVLMNLCANAAHAMAGDGGVLSVSFTDVRLEAESLLPHQGLSPGPHVQFTATDAEALREIEEFKNAIHDSVSSPIAVLARIGGILPVNAPGVGFSIGAESTATLRACRAGARLLTLPLTYRGQMANPIQFLAAKGARTFKVL